MPILGIDEVGRGPWAGPLVIGAVILKSPQSNQDLSLEAGDFLTAVTPELSPIWDELADSKKLTRKRREALAPQIRELAFAAGLGWVPAQELDELGLAAALQTAAKRAVQDCLANAGVECPEKYVGEKKNVDFAPNFPVDEIIIDGTVNFLRGTALEDLVTVAPKADALVKEVSAASIVAKVARDEYMTKIAAKYPEYGFEKHVGYGTAAHRSALEKYGPCLEHRRTFRPVAECRSAGAGGGDGCKGEGKDGDDVGGDVAKKNTTAVGQTAEGVVAEYLEKHGHKILARNYKTSFYEIDIVSATKEHIYFTEVKYRKTPRHGAPLEAITSNKQRQMAFAAEAFMKYLSRRLGRDLDSLPAPILAAAAVAGAEFELEAWFPIA